MQELIHLADIEEAVEFLIVNETLINAARRLYQQVLNNDLALDANAKTAMLVEIEETGLGLARVKRDVLNHVTNVAWPAMIMPSRK